MLGLVGMLLVAASCGSAAGGNPASGRPRSQDAATASTVLLRLSDLPTGWSEVGGVATFTGADLEFDQACMPGTSGQGYVYAVGRRLAYLAAPIGPNYGQSHGTVDAYARLTATAADDERILSEASSAANEACLRQNAHDDLEASMPRGGMVTGPATMVSTTPPFALPLAGNYFRVDVPDTCSCGMDQVESYETFRIQRGRLSASFTFERCCESPAFAASERQAIERVAARIEQSGDT